MRHATAWSQVQMETIDNYELALSPMGRAQALESGCEIAQHNLPNGVVIHSPLPRSRETAEIVAKEVNFPLQPLEKLNGSYSARHVWIATYEYFSKYDTVVMVGHHPGSGLLAGRLLKQPPFKIEKGCYMGLAIQQPHPEIDSNIATLEFSKTHF